MSEFDPESLADVPWLADLLDKPAEAAWPRLMTPPHPDARGSYGRQAERWARDELGLTLRWWQRLATRRQLECDADGDLVWGQVLESTPRRSGKSVRLRATALWRVDNADVFGEEQLVMFTGKDLPICKEIHRKSWRWAESRGWGVRRLNGHEEVAAPDGSRWLVRGKDSVYGYDTTLGMVDEAWDVAPGVVDDGLEPSTIERSMPQVVLTSTAHRRATSLMRRRIAAATAGMGEDFRTLLMLWGAPPGADVGDPEVWRLASPYWTPEREAMIGDKFERAMRGEADPDADDPDPLEGFRAQYLNMWPARASVKAPVGDPVVTAKVWAGCGGHRRGVAPAAAAVEGWFSAGVSVALADQLDGGRVGVSVQAFEDLPSAGEFLRLVRPGRLLAGKSIASDPVLRGLCEPMGATVRQASGDLARLVGDGVLVHDGGAVLTDQVLGLRVVAAPDGPRVKSTGRHDAVKACVWAVEAARHVEAPAVF